MILEVKKLTKAYDETHGVFDLDLSVEKGDIVLLLGLNGAGKTTAFRSILGLSSSKYDTLELMGKPMSREESLRHIGAMVSKPTFYDYLTGYEYLELHQMMFNVDASRIDEVLKDVDLLDAKDKKIKAYSTGMKQRLDLARAILHDPKLLVLDEPFSGMDIEVKKDMKTLLKSFDQTGIIISSHMIGDLEKLATRIVIIHEGRVKYNGSMDDVSQSGLDLEDFYLQRIAYKGGKHVTESRMEKII